MPKHEALTLADALAASFRDALRSPEGTAEPVALLGPDPDRQWVALARALADRMPALYRLGPYEPDQHCGPAIAQMSWKCWPRAAAHSRLRTG